ncbi:MAG TPA: hypothetical protein PLI18_10995 [Pirellulaceae bacterium]|nr:hypothetical protein [Pirellulaceae bacterium]
MNRSFRPFPSGLCRVASQGPWLVLLLILAATGCHRSYYRRQADVDAALLIAEKASDPRWTLPGMELDPDPRSRMYHPFSEDHPPMPPDDPTAGELMERVDGKPGYPHWRANGTTDYVANPEWETTLPRDPDGSVTITMKDAVELARLHSRDYQRQNEELYLSALDVSLERFNFESRLFAGYGTDFTALGRVRGGGESSSVLDASTGSRGIRLEKLGTTGSTLVVGLANSMLWQFSGPNNHTPNTLIDFSIVQPLLRGAGRDRILESLTNSERTLLANVRQMERYRRGFMLSVTTGRSPGPGPARGGAQIAPSSNASAQAGGYIGLLQNQQDIRIQESNIASLRNILSQFQAFAEADRVDFLQVQQSQSALFDAQARLLQTRNAYETTLDSYKITLGLPPELRVSIRDAFLDQFQLIDTSMTERQNALAELQSKAGESIVDLIDSRVDLLNRTFTEDGRPIDQRPLRSIRYDARVRDLLDQVRVRLLEAETQCRAIRTESLPRAESDVLRLEDSLDERRDALARLRRLLAEGSENVDRYDIEADILAEDELLTTPGQSRAIFREIAKRVDETEAAIVRLLASLDRIDSVGPTTEPVVLYGMLESEIFTKVPTQLTELSSLFLELTLAQVVARTEAIVLVPVEMSATDGLEIARFRRRDWMNARTSLVDSWRQIEVIADQLEADFGLVFEGDIGNVGDNPLNLRDVNGRLRAGFQFDSPITRLAERNAYRETLIGYHRDRRAYYAFEDEVSRSLRQTLRTLEQNRLNFELARRSVKVAVQQVDLAGSRLRRPPAPGSTNNQLGATTARDLVSALSQLQNNQSSFLQVWVGYEVLRRSLDFDLGTMELDEDGMWVDPGAITSEKVEGWLEEVRSAGGAPGVGAIEFPALPDDLLEQLESLEGRPADDLPAGELPSGENGGDLPLLPDLVAPDAGASVRPARRRGEGAVDPSASVESREELGTIRSAVAVPSRDRDRTTPSVRTAVLPRNDRPVGSGRIGDAEGTRSERPESTRSIDRRDGWEPRNLPLDPAAGPAEERSPAQPLDLVPPRSSSRATRAGGRVVGEGIVPVRPASAVESPTPRVERAFIPSGVTVRTNGTPAPSARPASGPISGSSGSSSGSDSGPAHLDPTPELPAADATSSSRRRANSGG